MPLKLVSILELFTAKRARKSDRIFGMFSFYVLRYNVFRQVGFVAAGKPTWEPRPFLRVVDGSNVPPQSCRCVKCTVTSVATGPVPRSVKHFYVDG